MKRRNFIKNAGGLIVGMGIFGNIRLAEQGFIGDTFTTTDILGPFYRPGAPLRNNLNPKDFEGEVLNLFGTIYKEDGKTPMSNCFIEVWQCRADGFYDNVSDEFSYRGSQQVATDGKYRFITTKPVPEPTDETLAVYRPAHIHMRVSAIGQQDLITQIYFMNDPHLDSDPSTKSALAVNRILSIRKTKAKESELKFDIILKNQMLPGNDIFHKVSGVYKMSDKSLMEFYRDGDLLFYKTNGQIWGALSYAGNERFVGGVNDTEAKFELPPSNKTNVQFRFIRRRKIEIEGSKIITYDTGKN